MEREKRFDLFLSTMKGLEGRIELDKRLLKNYYKNKGYYEVEISSSNVEYSEGEGFVLTYSINAGKRYKFKKIFANVADTLEKKAEELRDKIGLRFGPGIGSTEIKFTSYLKNEYDTDVKIDSRIIVHHLDLSL